MVATGGRHPTAVGAEGDVIGAFLAAPDVAEPGALAEHGGDADACHARHPLTG
jgi:hypothetical protein